MSEAVKVWKKYTRQQFLSEIGPEYILGLSAREILDWAQKKKTVSCYVLNPFGEVISPEISKHVELLLVFMINNKHCFPVVNQELKRFVSKTKCLDLAPQIFNTANFDSSEYTNSMDDVLDEKCTSTVVFVSL
jgi:hypothetical protein